jgi:hypothetical protein
MPTGSDGFVVLDELPAALAVVDRLLAVAGPEDRPGLEKASRALALALAAGPRSGRPGGGCPRQEGGGARGGGDGRGRVKGADLRGRVCQGRDREGPRGTT